MLPNNGRQDRDDHVRPILARHPSPLPALRGMPRTRLRSGRSFGAITSRPFGWFHVVRPHRLLICSSDSGPAIWSQVVANVATTCVRSSAPHDLYTSGGRQEAFAGG